MVTPDSEPLLPNKIRIRIECDEGIPFKLCELIYDKLDEIQEDFPNVIFELQLGVIDLDERR